MIDRAMSHVHRDTLVSRNGVFGAPGVESRPRRPRAVLAGLWFGLLAVVVGTGAFAELPPAAERKVEFARDVQPILARHCHSCHGEERAEGSLRLDRKADALAGGSRGPAILPGQSDQSRIVLFAAGESDEELRMPPEGEPLTAEEIGILRAWIDQGALWGEEAAPERAVARHWSLAPIGNPAIPAVANQAWCRNPIDRFILARLEREGISPSPEADRATLIRRLYLDLLGLPPEPEAVDVFLADTRPDAYEQLVERLLASPHYGERWARHWLDQARYADSDGYEKDTGRPHAWRYRHWVIDALNRDLPFDQFTILQLAGDLLAESGQEGQVAVGFYRNTLTNKEGGVDQEEYRVKATVDRVNTLGSVWLGLTLACAQCHSHKYDPFTQREYYELFAFFNSLQEVDVPAPFAEQVAAYQEARRAHEAARVPLAEALARYDREELPARQDAWERGLDLSRFPDWTVLRATHARTASGAVLAQQVDGSLVAQGDLAETDTYQLLLPVAGTITGLRLECLPDESLPGKGPGRAPNGNFVVCELALEHRKLSGEVSPVAIGRVVATFSQEGFAAAQAADGQVETGWAVAPRMGQEHVALFELAQPLLLAEGESLAITLTQNHGGGHVLGRFRLAATSAPGPLELPEIPSPVLDALRIAAADRNEEQRAAILEYYRNIDPDRAPLVQALAAHDKQAPVDPATQTLAQSVSELATPRTTHVMLRGDFLAPGAEVQPGTPRVLPPLTPRGPRPDRLDLARWLVSPEHPLTARVIVNRVWQVYFGRGLVNTEDDFGTQGERPSHPELLDWLARWWINEGWSLKGLHRLIVTSATYRQSSAWRADLLERDPLNTLLARQARLRVEAEIVRDLALAASGLLHRAIGGPSVRPPQPEGISDLTYANSARWVESTGPDRYRRGLYIWFQRTSPYPMLMTFDSPDANVACTRRERSNTPLQALTLLNDVVFVECAQALARRVLSSGSEHDEARLCRAFRLCLGRAPEAEELAVLRDLLHRELALCRDHPEAAALLAGPGLPAGFDAPTLAAWVAVARALLNLDEFVTRE